MCRYFCLDVWICLFGCVDVSAGNCGYVCLDVWILLLGCVDMSVWMCGCFCWELWISPSVSTCGSSFYLLLQRCLFDWMCGSGYLSFSPLGPVDMFACLDVWIGLLVCIWDMSACLYLWICFFVWFFFPPRQAACIDGSLGEISQNRGLIFHNCTNHPPPSARYCITGVFGSSKKKIKLIFL